MSVRSTKMSFAFVVAVCALLAVAFGAEPDVNCTAPRSPDHGQAFLYQEGRVVKYVCEPGYVLLGKDIVRCVEGQWEEPDPACIEMDADEENMIRDSATVTLSPPTSRPLFSWSQDGEEEAEKNATSDEERPMSDEAFMRMVILPRRRLVVNRLRAARLRSATELEEEEKKRSQAEGNKKSSTTIHLETPPSVLYVRKTVKPGKSDSPDGAASLHMTVDNGEDGDHVQVLSLPRAAVAQNDKGYTDEHYRHMYWLANHYYPRQSSLVEYGSGDPAVMTLSESQINWIHSLHPELRDRYLRDLYAVRIGDVAEGTRAQAFLRRYEDAYNMYYHPYLRQHVSLLVEDPVHTYDYSCHQAYSSFIKAPRLPNMHVARYDRRQNPNVPRNHYLSAVYRCNPGFVMLDTRHTELHCSKRNWIGVSPVCVPRG